MAEQVIAPIIPNPGTAAEAAAGNQGVVFTAADRQVIKERAGEVDTTRPFKEIFFKGDFTQKVENEQSTINPEMDLRAMESRRKEHKRILRYSAVTAPQEHVEISGEARTEAPVIHPPEVDLSAEATAPLPPDLVYEDKPATAAAVTPVVETGADQEKRTAAYDQTAEEQKTLNSIVSRIQELNFKRVLCDNEADFEKLSVEIKEITLSGSQPEARVYLEAKVDLITRTTAEYNLGVMQSLESMHYDENDKNIKWLVKMVEKYTPKA